MKILMVGIPALVGLVMEVQTVAIQMNVCSVNIIVTRTPCVLTRWVRMSAIAKWVILVVLYRASHVSI